MRGQKFESNGETRIQLWKLPSWYVTYSCPIKTCGYPGHKRRSKRVRLARFSGLSSSTTWVAGENQFPNKTTKKTRAQSTSKRAAIVSEPGATERRRLFGCIDIEERAREGLELDTLNITEEGSDESGVRVDRMTPPRKHQQTGSTKGDDSPTKRTSTNLIQREFKIDMEKTPRRRGSLTWARMLRNIMALI